MNEPQVPHVSDTARSAAVYRAWESARVRRCALWLIAATVLVFGVCSSGRSEESRHTFWEVKGRHNTLYLLGSVHMLKPTDSGLPSEALQAYAHSKGLVMELNLNELGADDLLGSDSGLETLPAGQSLEKAVGPDLYAKFLARAKPLGLDPEIVSHFQPWFAALMLQQLELTKSGFDAGAGVDEQFAQLAQADRKPIIGLETLDEQLGFFAHLSLEQQRQYFKSALEESDTDVSETDAIVRAWQRGDTVKLEQLMREGSDESPELYRMLTTERNRRWLPKLVQLLNDDDNYLVIVGALHLIGRDGVVELLKQQGYSPVQR